MNIQIYKKANTGKRKKLKKQITGLIIIGIVFISALWIIGIFAGDSDEYNERVSILEENHILRQKLTILTLNRQVKELEALVGGNYLIRNDRFNYSALDYANLYEFKEVIKVLKKFNKY